MADAVGNGRSGHSEPAVGRPRVLLVGTFLSSKPGTRSVCEDLSERLRARGWSVSATSRRRWGLARGVDMLLHVVTRIRAYDVAQVDVYSGRAFLWAYATTTLLAALGKPVVLTLHGGNLPEYAKKHPTRVQRLLAMADRVTAPSTYLLKALRGYRSDIQLIPNALELSVYKYRLRAASGQKLVWVRAFRAEYNPELAVRVLSLLRNRGFQPSLIMVGPDRGDGSLQRTLGLAETLGVADRFEVVGGVPKHEVPTWLDRGDILLNTTDVDNTPVSVIEAMACGLCVVSTNVGGIPYLLEDDTDALLVPPNDAEAMAGAVRRILTEPGLAERLSRNARKKAEAFDWLRILPQWEELLRKVSTCA